MIGGVGMMLWMMGIFGVGRKENGGMRELVKGLCRGRKVSGGLIVMGRFRIVWVVEIDKWVYI